MNDAAHRRAPRLAPGQVSLARALSKLGLCSRSQAREWIAAGRVCVNGQVTRSAERGVHLGRDRLAVDGRPAQAVARVYLMLNKPRGLVTTTADERGRGTVYDCLTEPELPWVAPVGRLDKASEGLLLLTNDTQWANRLLAPHSHLERTYHVQIRGLVSEPVCRRMEQGVMTSEGECLATRRAEPLRAGRRNTWLQVVLDEGKNRQIRRLLAALGYPVLRLIRVAFGPLILGDLPKGEFRALTPAEKQAVDQAIGLSSH